MENKIEAIQTIVDDIEINREIINSPDKECHDENYNHTQHDHNQNTKSISKKEYNSLKAHKYEEAVKKYKTSYTVMNTKTGLIVEMKAASSLHACTMIGWRAKNCKILKEVKDA